MVFSSPIFLFVFLPATYLGYRLLPTLPLRNAWLTLASLIFFSFGQLPYLILLLASVAFNYGFGLWLQMGTRRRLAAGLAVTVNLVLLGTFKYLDFFIATINGLLGTGLALTGLVLPIGISFYTFQGMSYVIDVYRHPEQGTKSLGKLLLYISFFPQLIAGPIVIYHDVAGQITQRELTPELTLSGLRRFIGGFSKKMLLANPAGEIADAVFALSAAELDFRLAWLGAICYTMQIYFDFSGYSDMAIGLGRMFGFRFLENFRLPYTAASIKEFWRRWHISLSSWFRDYLYIPLGGNRKGERRTSWNKLLVFLATGLWHGANWTFVLWGLWHGLFSTLEGIGVIPKRLCQSRLGHVYTMVVVILGFTLFRADSLAAAGVMFSAMFTGFTLEAAHTLTLITLLNAKSICLLLAAALFAFGFPQRIWAQLQERAVFQRAEGTAAVLGYGTLFGVSVLTLAGATFNPFIYFQF